LGGQGIAMRCDHSHDDEVENLFQRVQAERGRLDILVNNAWAGRMDAAFCDLPFWEQPQAIWDELHTVGFRSHYVASALAARLMLPQRAGLIINISSSGAARYVFNVAFGATKAGLEKMTADMAHELRSYSVAVIALWPGTVRTERVLAQPERWPLTIYRGESPQFAGRAVAALAADANIMAKTGQRLIVSDLALEYDFTDLDGTRPPLSPGIAALRVSGDPPSS
jgi:dehydrogenase/reductase SDR family protein 1